MEPDFDKMTKEEEVKLWMDNPKLAMKLAAKKILF